MKNLFFEWDNYIFNSWIKHCSLFIEWLDIEDIRKKIETISPDTMCFSNDFEEQLASPSSENENQFMLLIDSSKRCKFVLTAYSFNCTGVEKYPLITVKCRSKQQSGECKSDMIDLKEECLIYCVIKDGRDQRKQFSLHLLHKITFNPRPACRILFLKDFSVLYYQDRTASINLKEYQPDSGAEDSSLVYKYNELKQFVSFLDSFTISQSDGSTLVLVKETLNEEAMCSGILCNSTDSSCNVLLEKQFHECIFSKDFHSLVITAKILKCSKEDERLFCSVIILTRTSYCLSFSNGQLQTCVYLASDFDFTQQLSIEAILILNCHVDGKTVIKVCDKCFLLDLQKSKILETWQNVVDLFLKFPGFDDSRTLLLLQEQNSAVNLNNTRQLSDFKISFKSVEIEETRTVEKTETLQYSDNCNAGAVAALKSQRKKCVAHYRELQRTLHKKKLFLEEQLQFYSLSPTQDSSSVLIPLVSSSSNADTLQNVSKQEKSHIKVNQVWMHTLLNYLVFGVVISLNQRLAADPKLYVFSSNSSRQGSVMKTSSCIKSSLSANNNRQTHTDNIFLNRSRKQQEYPTQMTLTVAADVKSVVSTQNQNFQFFIEYKYSNCNDKVQELKLCGEKEVSMENIFDNTMSIDKKLSENTDELTDLELCALNSVQRKKSLKVVSQVSNLQDFKTCLTSKTEDVIYIESLEQFVFHRNHLLKFSRIELCQQISSHILHINVFSFSDEDILMCINYIYSCCHRDVKVLPLVSNQSQVRTQIRRCANDVLEQVKREIDELTSELSDLQTTQKDEKAPSPLFKRKKRKL